MLQMKIAFLVKYLVTMVVFCIISKITLAKEPILPIPIQAHIDDKKVALGKALFHDQRLSKNNTISCASCHPLTNAGMDNLKVSPGINGHFTILNTPTVFNSALQAYLFWDGRAFTLEQQIDGPIHNPIEMNSDWPSIIEKLRLDKQYTLQFNGLYNDGISATAIKDAIASFERTLITPNSRFDQFLKGDVTAITKQEAEGYNLFKSYGCSSCHQGVAIGGNMFEKMGIIDDYFSERGNVTVADYGRFNVTGIEEHRYEFRVPSLRNIELTAPYFHDGSAITLRDAIRVMAKYQLGIEINKKDTEKILKFLYTLTGDFGEYASE